ncbi:uncharacterized protein Dvar_30790 [Desulfosarcina variabilis str. Montpellier]|uniref:hypothetical protein n=1 Tax=Desulfosarcina variabilis TaxID=2300 RepID=UPI003AFA7D0B
MVQENEEKARNYPFRAFKVNSVSRPDVQYVNYFKLRRRSRPDVKVDPNILSLVQKRFLYVPALLSWACLLTWSGDGPGQPTAIKLKRLKKVVYWESILRFSGPKIAL